MAKLALINREAKRRATVAKFAAKRAALKAIIIPARWMNVSKPAHSSKRCRATLPRSVCATVARLPVVPVAISVSSVFAVK